MCRQYVVHILYVYNMLYTYLGGCDIVLTKTHALQKYLWGASSKWQKKKKDNTFLRWGWDCQVLGNGSRLHSPEAQECIMVFHWGLLG